MQRKILLVCSGIFLLASVILSAAAFLTIGMNDAESKSILSTGAFSRPGDLVWTPWQPNDQPVRPYPGFRGAKSGQHLYEIRRGQASGAFFDFTIYEGRTVAGDPSTTVPAIAADWGATYHTVWALGALGMAAVFASLALYPRNAGARGKV